MTETNKRRAYDCILRDIIGGAFKGEPVLNERRLIERYGIGKTPVREALVELCSEKVLRAIPRYGYEILQLTAQDVSDVLRFRSMLECQTLRECAPSLTRDALKAFRDFVEAERAKDAGDAWAAWESNTRVHMRLLGFGGNRYGAEMLSRSMAILKRAYAQMYDGAPENAGKGVFSDEVHLQLADALLAGDFEGAVSRLNEDIFSFGRPNFSL